MYVTLIPVTTVEYDFLDDIDYHFNKVKRRKIEQMLPQLNKKVEEDIKGYFAKLSNSY